MTVVSIADRVFRPGETVQDSGIYQVRHRNQHRPANHLVLLSGQTFPVCSLCGDAVRFECLLLAPHIFDDDDFRDGGDRRAHS